MARRVCVLMSGGLDSGVLIHRLLHTASTVTPLYIQCGLRWEAIELYWLRRFLRQSRRPNLDPLQVIRLPLDSLYGRHWSVVGRGVPGARSADEAVYLPGRNVVLLSAAAVWCASRRISTIAIGVLQGNPFGDASPRFFTRLSACLSEALRSSIRIWAPFARESKSALIRSAAGAPLGLTFSCLGPRGRRHCGRCNKCAERRRAFRSADVADPTAYAS